MRRFLTSKLATYLVAFFVGVTVDWGIPHLMPGDPVQAYLSTFRLQPAGYAALYKTMSQAFGTNLPLWEQYLHYWQGILTGNLGVSYTNFPSQVNTLITQALPYTLALLVPAITLSYVLGNRLGAAAARRKALDNTVLPAGYLFQAMPYPWVALVIPYLLAVVWHVFPMSGGYALNLLPTWSWTFIWSLLTHWFLPFLTVFIVSLGGWAIGMRNLVIYELENDSSRYLRSLGARERVVRRYAYRNASLPQLSGLALQLGVVVGGNIVTEIAFQYPGLGHLLYQAITNRDYFLLQGIFIFIIIGVLAANFLIDLVFTTVDPRTRLSMQGRRHEYDSDQGAPRRDGTRQAAGAPERLPLLRPAQQEAGVRPRAGDPAYLVRHRRTCHLPAQHHRLLQAGREAVGAELARHRLVRARCLRTARGGTAAELPGGRAGRGLRRGRRHGARLHRGLAWRAARRGAAAAHQRHRHDPLPRAARGHRLLHEHPQRAVRGRLHRAHHLAVGGPCGARTDVLAALAGVRRAGQAVGQARHRDHRQGHRAEHGVLLFLVVILLFGSSMLLAASYDFLGLGPSNTVSLGWMMQNANLNSALFYHMWWWILPPGIVLTAMVAALLVANVGLDEVFNPKLRKQ
jgi:peptide/nickel transport system permease protein